MGESHDVMNLEWVQSDIEQTLLQAQEHLEACLSGSGEHQVQLKSCYDAVHQVTGSLQMVGLAGAVLLTEQIESLLDAMLNGAVENVEDAYAAIAQALVHLPPYLARVKADVDEAPILLLTAINDIRKVLGEVLILEYSLFNPRLGETRPDASDEVKTHFAEHGAANITKMRQIYQFALIGLIRNEDVKINLVRVSNVLARLQQDCKGARINQLWEVSSAAIEGLIGDSVVPDTDFIELLRSTDKEIKKLAESGPEGLDRQPDSELLMGLLFRVAKTSTNSAHIEAIKQEYDLDRYQLANGGNPHAGLFVGPDKETLNSAVSALSEELQRIKDTIDLYVRNEIKANIDLGGLQPSLRQIASTLVMLNLETPRVVVQEQLDILSDHSNGGAEIPDQTLLKIAEALLYVETELQGIVERVNSGQEDGISAYAVSAAERVVLESLANVKQAKDDIQEFVAGHADFERLENVPSILRGAYGGLSMLSLSDVAQLVYSVAQYVEDDILALSKVPDPQVMDTLAEVIATAEYYLEGLAEDKPASDQILEQAKTRIASLGYPVEQSEGITSEDRWDETEPEQTSAVAPQPGVDNAEPDIEPDMLEAVEGSAEVSEQWLPNEEPEIPEADFAAVDVAQDETAEPVAFTLADEAVGGEVPVDEQFSEENVVEESVSQESAGVEELGEELIEAELAQDSGSDEVKFELPVVDEPENIQPEHQEIAQEQPLPAAEVAAVDEEEELVDEEILEIFEEEAEEVFVAIAEHWPLYVDNFANTDSLAEVRRAFHTLKGSGRMVKAEVIGELAWSVENLLNHVIDESVSMNRSIAVLVDEVRAVLPELLKHFMAHTDPQIDVSGWMERAERLQSGEEIEEQPIEEQVAEEPAEQPETVVTDEFQPVEPEFAEGVTADSDEESIEPIAQEWAAEQSEQFPKTTVESAEQEEADIEYPAEAVSEQVAESEGFVGEHEEQEPSLNEIFSREADIHIAVVGAFIAAAEQSEEPIPFTEELYRALHTLKGSARMASIEAIAEIAAAGESLAKELGGYEISADREVVMLLQEAHSLMRTGIGQLDSGQQVELVDAPQLIDRMSRMQAERLALIESAAQGEAELSPALKFLRDNIDLICDVSEQFEQWREQPQPEASLFAAIIEKISRLNAAAQACEQQEIETLLATLEYVYRTIDGLNLLLGEKMLSALTAAHEGLVGLVDQLAAGQQLTLSDSWAADLDNALTELQEAQPEQIYDEAEQSVEPLSEAEPSELSGDELEVFAEEPVAPPVTQQDEVHISQDEEIDHELIEIFLTEADEIVEATAEAKQRWMDDPANFAAVDELQRGLHTLKGSSRMAGIGAIGDLSHELESIYEDVNAGRVNASQELFDLVHECDDRLMDMIAELRAGAVPSPAQQLIAKVREFHHQQLHADAAPVEDAGQQRTVVFDTALGTTVEADADQLQSFFAAADQLLAKLTNAVKKSEEKNTVTEKAHGKICDSLAQLQQLAYESSVNEIGDLCQVFAELVRNLSAEELSSADTIRDISEWLERIDSSYQEAKSAAIGDPADSGTVQEEKEETESSAAPASSMEQKQGRETVRVSAQLLEQLVDLAGETSVSRSRVEQQVSNFGYAIDEMGSTIERLREQLRRMEIETEAQILFGQEREGPEHEGFDPLEMDRYSRIQELSRALVESVSDLFDLKDTLQERSRYTENLLLQQSRINTELQEGLMKTRMVPFSRLLPRLRRVVRQVGNELGKKAEFQVKNVDAELDRSLLEHMTAPLEHMLRNAVDHGIEKPEQRTAAGKAETGQIRLELSRDGGDILLTLTDDGAGIDVESVRAKAVERGLMAADANLSDHQVLQFIMQAGFSTAKEVTQISGRGVGMDVVCSEIKQLGGSIEIDSVPGKGSRFSVRVPFTVSINRALMVTVGDETYALPLSTVEGVVRVTPYELEEYYRADGPDFEYAGQRYDLHYLGEYMGHGNSYQLQNQALPLPVILIRTAEHTAAIQVDSISGSREIVVKPLGPQLGVIPGMSGATILGDGRVVLILDMAAMIRSMAAVQSRGAGASAPAVKVSENLQVMVVDDSVTVRKVASRLLERHGMDVVIAKDGVEAMTKLQDTLPDIMLLDIEMPRMDGFELASLMRHDERLQDVPIVMITSRTGDKHRERALEIGVNRFMGKPFQEAELLDAISDLTDFERYSSAQGE